MGNTRPRSNDRICEKPKEMKYAVVDMGKNMAAYCSAIQDQLERDGVHYVLYLTDMDNLICIEFVTEDEFLDHFKNTNKNGKA
jgi:hypothetical protein